MRTILKFVKIAVDMVMLCLFIYLMCYREIRALGLHAIMGTVLFALFFAHHLLNYKWYKVMFKGKYKCKRVILLLLNTALWIAMTVMLISSFMMSGAVVDFGIAMTQFGRDLHICSTAWGFVIMALHLGFHLHALLRKAERKSKGKLWEYAVYVAVIALALVGLFGFWKSGLLQDMFLIIVIKEPVSVQTLCLEYVGTVLLFSILMHSLLLLHEIISKAKNRYIVK